ncbi:cell wall surface anchor family protein [Listeria monocytogenes FSL F6-684]|nr:cell wall surface anchor family protein [Listeria monocytogenes FSL F6-684]
MVFPKKLVASIAVFISLGFIYFRVSTAVAFENTSSASLLPSTGDAFFGLADCYWSGTCRACCYTIY